MNSFVTCTTYISVLFFVISHHLTSPLCCVQTHSTPLGCFPSKSTSQCKRGSRRKGATTAAQAVLCQEQKVQFAPPSNKPWCGVTMPAIIEACTYVQHLAPLSTPATLAIAKHNHASPLTHACPLWLYRLVGIVLAFYKTFKVLRPSGATDASPMLKFWCASGRFPCQPHLFMHTYNSVLHSLVSTCMTCRILFGVLHFVGGLVS